MSRSPLKWPWKLPALRSHLRLWQHGELSCEGIVAVPEHSSHALREMPSAGCSRCKVCSTCAWQTHHLSPTREINAWWAQHKLSTGLWAPEYLLMDLLRNCVPVQCLGSYSSVTARHRYRCTWGIKLFPLWDTFLTPLCFFSWPTLYSSHNETFLCLYSPARCILKMDTDFHLLIDDLLSLQGPVLCGLGQADPRHVHLN